MQCISRLFWEDPFHWLAQHARGGSSPLALLSFLTSALAGTGAPLVSVVARRHTFDSFSLLLLSVGVGEECMCNPMSSRPGCMPGGRSPGARHVHVLFARVAFPLGPRHALLLA